MNPPAVEASSAAPDLAAEAARQAAPVLVTAVPDEATAEAQPEASPEAPAEEPASAQSEPPAAAEAAPVPAPPAPAVAAESGRRTRLPGPLALLKLDKVDEDPSLRLRDEGDIDTLATSMARLGQLFPVDLRLRPPDRFQVITGFRRIAALRLLKRERVLARIHTDLNDEDALRFALADLIEHRGADRDELASLKERLQSEGRLTQAVADTLERAINPPEDGLCSETVDGPDEEVDLDELAQDVIGRLAALNQDLAIVAELYSALDSGLRESLLEQLGYSEQLVRYLRAIR